MKFLLTILTLVILTESGFASDFLLSSDTESSLPNSITPPEELIRFVLKSIDDNDAESFNRCLKKNRFRKSEAGKLFAVVKLSLNTDKIPDFFVRPALEPYCFTFYGAHLFRYWFVTSHASEGKVRYKIALKNGGDGVAVLPTVTNGYHDIQIQSHTATELFTSTLKYDGKEYTERDCYVELYDEGKVVEKMSCSKYTRQ